MTSQTKLNANRANAQHSTGPVTAEGKARASRNSNKLGLFTAAAFVLPEDQSQYDDLVTQLNDELQPQGALEQALALEVIRATWRLERCGKLESILADQLLDGTAEENLFEGR